jgi:hypothetical protein
MFESLAIFSGRTLKRPSAIPGSIPVSGVVPGVPAGYKAVAPNSQLSKPQMGAATGPSSAPGATKSASLSTENTEEGQKEVRCRPSPAKERLKSKRRAVRSAGGPSDV